MNCKVIWKPIKNFDGIYIVSTEGKIKSLSRLIPTFYGFRKTKEKYIKTRLDKDGYELINLSKNTKQFTYKVHRIVAETFIKNSFNKPEVNHRDKIKNNNRLHNLEWVTAKENSLHRDSFKKNNNVKIL